MSRRTEDFDIFWGMRWYLVTEALASSRLTRFTAMNAVFVAELEMSGAVSKRAASRFRSVITLQNLSPSSQTNSVYRVREHDSRHKQAAKNATYGNREARNSTLPPSESESPSRRAAQCTAAALTASRLAARALIAKPGEVLNLPVL